MHTALDVQLNLVPFDSAQRDARTGAGPRWLIGGGLPERLTGRGHRVVVDEIVPPDDEFRAEISTAFSLNRLLSASVAAARARGAFPITLAGNCISAVGTTAGLGAGVTGILWFDAHGDLNTPETTIGGFLDGMGLAIATGRCFTQLSARVPGFVPAREENVILVGARDLDPLEAELLSASAITHLSDEQAATRLGESVAALARRVDRLYVHVDLDVLDPSEGIANSFAVGPGLTLAALTRAIEIAGAHVPIAAAAITSYDPSYDRTGSVCRAGIIVVETLATVASTTHATS
jgi:arginase